MKLYKEFGVNPAAGCLPVLLQFPIIWALYAVLQQIVRLAPEKVTGYVNSSVYISSFRISHPWDQHFFGIPIGQSPSNLVNSSYLILLVPILTGVFQLIQSKMMISTQAAPVKKTKAKEEDFAASFQSQSLFIFPFMIGFFSYTLPFGLSLYWNTFTIFGILQQYRIQGLGGLVSWLQTAFGLWNKTKNK